MMRDYTNQMRKIELRTKEAEKRASDAMTQVAFLSNNLGFIPTDVCASTPY